MPTATTKKAMKKPAKSPVKKPAKSPVKKPAAKKTPAKKPAKKAAARTPTVSPLRGMDVAAWIAAKTSGWQTDLIDSLLVLVQRAAPEATVSIKWAQPVFEQLGPFAYIKPAKAHVTFGFWRGATLADPKKLLTPGGKRMAHVKLTGPALDAAALSAFVKEAVRLNRESGDPTKR